MPILLPTQKRLNGWAIFYALMGLSSVLLLSLVCLYWIWSSGQARLVKKLTAEIRAAGEPINGEELTKCFLLEKDQEDATKLWLEGIEGLSTPENKRLVRELLVEFYKEETFPKLVKPWPKLDACSAFLATNQSSLDKFHEAASRGGNAKFAADYSQGLVTPLPVVDELRYIARILQMECEVKTRQGNIRGAAKAMRSLLCLPRCLNREPVIVAFLVRTSLDDMAIGSLADRLCLVPFTDTELMEFQQLVRSNAPERVMQMALIGERALGHTAMLDPRTMGDERPSFSPLNGDIASHLLLMNDFITAAEQGFPECFAAYEIAEVDFAKRGKSWAARWTMIYTSSLIPGVYSSMQAAARDIACLRALDAGIAVELYRRDTGSLPESLTQLAPKYLTAPPIDPYTGDPLFFKKTPQGFTIYCVGKNKINDGGVLGTGKNTDEGLFFPLK